MENASGVVVIQIRDSRGEYRRHLYVKDDEPQSLLTRRLQTSFGWLTGPPAGAASARSSVNSFRNDEQLDALSAYFNESVPAGGTPFFTTVVFERPGDDIGMNWYLTEADKDRIVKGFDDKNGKSIDQSEIQANLKARAALKRWWESTSGSK